MKLDRNKIEQFLQWEGGQRLFNFAYSVGAAIVILGALFKILHLPGGNTLLMVGMGTEVLMFLITAFDRPPQEYKWEEVFPQLKQRAAEGDVEAEAALENLEMAEAQARGVAGGATFTGVGGGGIVGGGGGTVIIGGSGGSAATGEGDGSTTIVGGQPGAAGVSGPIILGGGGAAGRGAGDVISDEDADLLSQSIHRMADATEQMSRIADMGEAARDYMTKLAAMSDQLNRLNETTRALNHVSEVLLDSYRTITENSESINRSSTGYVEQMQALNHNVAGLNHIYEIQLRSVSSQLDSIDRVNRGIKDIRDMYEKSAATSGQYYEETEKMTRYMQQLNNVYENMIHAMTVNMYRPAPPVMPNPTMHGSVDGADNN